MNKQLRALTTSVALFVSVGASAHGGVLNADGCHTNRKTGDYHCHRAPARPTPAQAPAPQAALSPSDTLPAANSASATARSATAPVCYTGPRGGTYTLKKSGKKNYGGC